MLGVVFGLLLLLEVRLTGEKRFSRHWCLQILALTWFLFVPLTFWALDLAGSNLLLSEGSTRIRIGLPAFYALIALLTIGSLLAWPLNLRALRRTSRSKAEQR